MFSSFIYPSFQLKTCGEQELGVFKHQLHKGIVKSMKIFTLPFSMNFSSIVATKMNLLKRSKEVKAHNPPQRPK